LANGSVAKLLQALTRIYKALSAFFQIIWQTRKSMTVERRGRETFARGKGVEALGVGKNVLSKFG
jgi:hypothetical protein